MAALMARYEPQKAIHCAPIGPDYARGAFRIRDDSRIGELHSIWRLFIRYDHWEAALHRHGDLAHARPAVSEGACVPIHDIPCFIAGALSLFEKTNEEIHISDKHF